MKATFTYDSEKREGSFEIEQTQENKEKGIPLFDLPLELGWISRGMRHTEKIHLNRKKKSFRFSMDEPEQIRIDPYSKTVHKLSFNPGDGLLRKQLTEAKDVVGRILAAKELAATGKAKNIETIRQWVQGLTGTELFAAEIYFLSKLPAVVDPTEVIAVVLMGLALSLSATLYPSWRAAHTDPAEALRYE